MSGYLFPFLNILIHFHIKSYEAYLGAVTAGLVVQRWKPCFLLVLHEMNE